MNIQTQHVHTNPSTILTIHFKVHKTLSYILLGRAGSYQLLLGSSLCPEDMNITYLDKYCGDHKSTVTHQLVQYLEQEDIPICA